MECRDIRARLGEYLDGELEPALRAGVEAHLQECLACQQEIETLQRLADDLAQAPAAEPPASLWPAILQRLDHRPVHATRRHFAWPLRIPTVAAAVLLVVGIGLLLNRPPVASQAQAGMVDFSVLLDRLPQGIDAAFAAFLDRHDAEPIDTGEVRAAVPDLDFAMPPTLPGGFALKQVYRLRFGDAAGITARYEHGDEVLVATFHVPAAKEDYGEHSPSPCTVGSGRGSRVEVGPWRLVRMTDGRACRCAGICRCGHTCSCVISTIKDPKRIEAVMLALVPQATFSRP